MRRQRAGTPSRTERPRRRSTRPARAASEPIAIIGIGCRFPGGASDPGKLWRLLADGRDAVVDVPADRWDTSRFYDADPAKPAKMYVRKAAFLREPIDHFDPFFFGMSPREVACLDPQQRLLLEVSWEALENAGLVATELAGANVGVYIGAFALDHMVQSLRPNNRYATNDHHAATAGTMTMLANRLSYTFDFRGPSLALDTACSSSLVALHQACQAMWRGECSMALVGGANVMLCPEFMMTMAKGHFLAPDGHCKSFDERADGYGRGEGAGIVVLKPLSAALADGDGIWALVRATGVNQDGRTDGITAPNPAAQERLIREVYANAGIELHQVRYVEAHGTGTFVGDPIEASVIGRTIGAGRADDDACVIGSIKANIGHLEAAAGIAGVIKAALCLSHRQIPPQVGVQQPNPRIPFAAWGLRLPRQVEPMPPGNGPAYVGVNSFGYGGTNAHVALEEPPPHSAEDCPRPSRPAHVLTLSARSEGALRQLAQSYIDLLREPAPPALGDLCYSAAARRSHFEQRLAVAAGTTDAVIEQLRAYVDAGRGEWLSTGKVVAARPAKLVFVFSGMGPQWWGMGRELLAREQVFRQTAETCDEVFTRMAGWSILSEMQAEPPRSRMNETGVAQPANFVLQVALAATLRSWGITPAAFVGHSVGEVAAAYVAGALALEDAVRVIYHRSRLQQTAAGAGTMLAVGLPARAARALLDGREGRVSIAAINSPSAVTLSGDGEALAELSVELERRQVFNRFLQVEVPYHSPLMEPLKDELCRCLEGLQAKRPAVALYSTLTGALVQDACHGPGYWYHNIRQPVLLADAVDRILDDGHTIFLELGPHPVLAGSINESMTRRGIHGGAIASLRRGQQEALTMAQAVGSLYTSGCSIDWNGLHPEPRRHVRLPTYPWQREKYWSEAEISMADRISNAVHPLLGVPLSLPVSTWECELSANVAPYLADHVIEGLPVLPATAYVEAGLALHALIDGGGGRSTLEDVEFTKALIVDPRNNVRLQWNYDEKTRECRVYSRPFGDKGVWTHHAKARLASASSGPAPQIDLETLKACCGQHLDGAELYGRLRAHGLEYGPAFQRVREVWRRPGEVVARLDATLADETNDAAYRLHPALLDACFQSIFATLDDATDEAAGLVYVPVRIQQIRYFGKPTATCWCHGQLTSKSRSAIEANLVLCDADGHTLAQVKGLRCSAIRAGKTDDARWAQWAYSFAWEQGPPVASAGEPGRWLLFIDRQGVGSLLAEWLCRDGASAAIQVVRAGALPRPALSAAVPIPGGDRTAMAELVDRIGPKGLRGVVYLWGLDLPEGGGDPTGTDGAIDALHLLQALGETLGSPAPRVYVVTRGAQQVTPDEPLGGLRQAPLVGLCRVAACEHPSLRSTAIDVESTCDLDLDAVGQLASELLANSAEDDVALRRAGRYVHRLQRAPVQQFEENAATARLIAPANGHAFRLEVATPGTTDSLRFRQIERREPGPGEVEVKIEAAGLNFKDVLKVLGVLPERAIEHTFHGNRMGMEAGGVIARVGSGVHDYQVGDAIVASMRDCFSSHVTLPTAELFAVSRPTKLSALDAAALPVTYITAYYGLHKVARLARGETVLIHAAAGGVGLAAIQVARWLGADILATAGSEEKRDYVRGLGIEHVWDSRNLDFADGVMAVTGGRGVDVVLNSVPGETFLKSLSLLAPYGRFIDIGKRDIVENGQMPMLPFERALTFTALDLDRMTAERPDVVRSLLQEVCGLVEAGHLGRLPIKVFPPAHAAEAFRYMALSKQIGKIVFDMDDTEGLSLLPATDRERPFRADATYLITGGCGGFGLELAEWLAAEGARYLVLAGRRGAATPAAQQVVEALTAQGVSVMASATDVAREADVVGLLAEIADKMPPLAGVFHLAAVLDDALLTNLDGARLRTVMAPKALGAWLLHEHTRDLPLDYFVLFSSASAWLGNVGQASYVAANAFLDALAQHRRAMGLPATSISWGAIGQVGMAAEREQAAEHLARMGVRTIPPGAATEALGHVLRWRPTGIALMDMDWSRWRIHALAESVPRFSPVLPDAAAGSSHTGSELRALLLATPPEARVEKLAAVIAELVADTLHMPSDKVDVNQPLSTLGVDSLVGMELQTSISVKFRVQVSILELMKEEDITAMSAQLLKKMNIPSARTAAPDAPEPVAGQTAAWAATGTGSALAGASTSL